MFEKKEEKVFKKKHKAKPSGDASVLPLKDFVLHHNGVHIELKEGVECMVPEMFLENLKTEKVIGG